MRWAIIAIVAGFGLTAPAAAAEQQPVYDGFTVDEVELLMAGAGLSPVVKGEPGDQWITGSTDGISFTVNFYSCEGTPARCLQIQFLASFNTDEEQEKLAMVFNKEKVFGRVYLTDDAEIDVLIEHPIHMNGGVTRAFLVNNLELWQNVLTEFTEKIKW